MSWIQRLYETYEKALVNPPETSQALMPINHTLQNAHIKIVIDQSGNLIRADVLGKTQIILPATEKSASRANVEAPHPLADKLQYVAGDYAQYGGKKKHYFAGYLAQLTQWCESPYAHAKVKAVLAYVTKGTVIQDLISQKVCFVDEHNVLRTNWPFSDSEDNPTPQLFKLLPKEKGEFEQGSALVCWEVVEPQNPQTETWLNEDIKRSWIDFEASNAGESAFCYVTGESKPVALIHPAKLRHSGDKAKLISSNDSSGFTFRGRAEKSTEIANVSADVTQKAHNALSWLIANQPRGRTGDQAIVCWAISGKTIPDLMVGTDGLGGNQGNEENGKKFKSRFAAEDSNAVAKVDYTQNLGQRFASRLLEYFKGYYSGEGGLNIDETIVIMGVDSATPGRMGIIYYREKRAEDFIRYVNKWHEQFAWPQRLKKEITDQKGKPKEVTSWIPGAPSPWNILQTAYGDIVKSNENLKKSINERLLPCISDGRAFPSDLVKLAVNRASNPNSGEYWEWERNIGVACALFKGFHARHPEKDKQKEYSMSLDRNYQGRDYLFGRLLAVAENIEATALRKAQVNRPTSANRLMQRFAQKPMQTWLTIYDHLTPYIRQLQSSASWDLKNKLKEIDEIKNLFEIEEFSSNKPLSGEYLLGFHCQRLYMDSDEFKPAKPQKAPEQIDLTTTAP